MLKLYHAKYCLYVYTFENYKYYYLIYVYEMTSLGNIYCGLNRLRFWSVLSFLKNIDKQTKLTRQIYFL